MSKDRVKLELDEANSVQVHLHGATLTSWICQDREMIFLSDKAVFDNKKAIRGGIPIIFPNFGPWDGGRPQHGFARIKKWSLQDDQIKKSGESVSASFVLVDDDETRSMWDHRFKLIYTVVLTNKELTNKLEIINTGGSSFDFTCLFHAYYRVDDISRVRIHGLKGLEYIDKVNNYVRHVEEQELLEFREELDRIYLNTADVVEFQIDDNKTRIRVEKENLPEIDVWNPWSEKTRAMTDMGDEEYKLMVCVQPGLVGASRYKLDEGEAVTVKQTVRVLH